MMDTLTTNFPIQDPPPAGMAESLSREAFEASAPRLFPVLRIETTPQIFASPEIRFQDETDDLDAYRVARFRINGVLALLQRYAASAPNEINLFADMDGCVATGQSPRNVAADLLNALGLGESRVIWENIPLQSHYTELL